MALKVYEPKYVACDICKSENCYYLIFCRQPEGELPVKVYNWMGVDYPGVFSMHVCKGCRDKVPYETIPVRTTLEEGFFFCPDIPKDFKPPEFVDTSSDVRGILTRYGKKILRQKNSE
jgi:hypothetical protein